MPSNSAAWLPEPYANPLVVDTAPYTSASEGEIVIKTCAVAINPVDVAFQTIAPVIFPFLKYPLIGGEDVSGEVVEVGPGVTRFNIGDRVVGAASGSFANVPARSGFQEYTVLSDYMTSAIPSTISYERAAVIPLGFVTAACGLFEKGYLELERPTNSPKPTGSAILITGGASSVGSNAIQLAVAAGYEVISTASPKNFEYVKTLGASQVFDYKSRTIIEDLINACKGKDMAGSYAIGAPALPTPGDPNAPIPVTDICFKIAQQPGGSNFVASAGRLGEEIPSDVNAKFVVTSDLQSSGTGRYLFEEYLPKALEESTFVPAPKPLVVGKGLENIQIAFNKYLSDGVSGAKLVVTL